jgi:RHS repeat-associated protein
MWLAEAGLYHYKARLYDPGLGRFLQTDPIGYADGLNLYAYVGGDPVNATDPTGTLFLFSAGGGSCVHACSEGTSPSSFGNSGFNNVFGFGGGSTHGGGGDSGGGGGGGSVPPPGPHSNPSPFINTGIQQIASLTPPDRFACTDPYGCITIVGYRDSRREGLEAARDFLNQAIRQALIDVLVSGIQNFAEETRQSEGAEELCEIGKTLVVAGRLETYVGAGGALVGGYLAGFGGDLRVRGAGLAIGIGGGAFALLGLVSEDTGKAYQYFYCAR